MTIYSKTMAGRMAALDAQSGLSPEHRKFLKSVDGKTSANQLLVKWRGELDTAQLLDELERKGLIEIRATRWASSAANPGTRSSFADSSPPAAAPQKPLVSAREELDAIKEHMATFMLTHLPHHAISMLKEIENIDSYDQLTVMLVAYAHMAHDAGRTGLAHIKSLRDMIATGLEHQKNPMTPDFV